MRVKLVEWTPTPPPTATPTWPWQAAQQQQQQSTWNSWQSNNNNNNNGYNGYRQQTTVRPATLKRAPKQKAAPLPKLQPLLVDEDICASSTVGEFEYQVCLFQNVTQTSNRWGAQHALGVWDSWQLPVTPAPPVLYYSDGESCASSDREVRVQIVCGEKNVLRDVQEAKTCSYEMVFETALLCDQNNKKKSQDQPQMLQLSADLALVVPVNATKGNGTVSDSLGGKGEASSVKSTVKPEEYIEDLASITDWVVLSAN